MLYTICLPIVVFAQPVSRAESDGSVESSVVEESVVESETASEVSSEDAQATESPKSMLPVQMTLKNGIVLTGSMEFQQLLTWTPQSTETIRFYMDSGAVQVFACELISSVIQVTTSPSPAKEEAMVVEVVEEVVEAVEEEVDDEVICP